MTGIIKSLEEEIKFSQEATEEEFNAYILSLTSDQRNFVVSRAIKCGHEWGFHEDAKELFDLEFIRRTLDNINKGRAQ